MIESLILNALFWLYDTVYAVIDIFAIIFGGVRYN